MEKLIKSVRALKKINPFGVVDWFVLVATAMLSLAMRAG